MSGGFFDYKQYQIQCIIEELEKVIQNKLGAGEGLCRTYSFSEEIINKFKEGLEILKKAEIYINRIDWLLSGDDGEEQFLERLKEELES